MKASPLSALPALINSNNKTADQPDESSTLCPRAQNWTVQQHAAKILGSWRKSTDLILETANACATAWESLEREDRVRLVEQLRPDISRESFSKLVSIGRNEALHDPRIRNNLPSRWTILHTLRDCTAEELDRAIEAGVLSRHCSRKAVQEWLAEQGANPGQIRTERLDSGEDSAVNQLLAILLGNDTFTQLWKRNPAAVRSRVCRVLMEDSRFGTSSPNGMA